MRALVEAESVTSIPRLAAPTAILTAPTLVLAQSADPGSSGPNEGQTIPGVRKLIIVQVVSTTNAVSGSDARWFLMRALLA